VIGIRWHLPRYRLSVDRDQVALGHSLSEKDRRRYTAIEVAKLGHGGAEYIASVLGCDPKTIRQGQHDLGHLPDDLGDRVRQKGVDASGA
jgi:hypothetical protein